MSVVVVSRYAPGMTQKTAVTIAAVGAALALVGLVFGVMPVASGTSACGSAFMPGEWADGCTKALASYRSTAWALLIPGALVVLFGGVAHNLAADKARRVAA